LFNGLTIKLNVNLSAFYVSL
jgi:hypothetical protein